MRVTKYTENMYKYHLVFKPSKFYEKIRLLGRRAENFIILL